MKNRLAKITRISWLRSETGRLLVDSNRQLRTTDITLVIVLEESKGVDYRYMSTNKVLLPSGEIVYVNTDSLTCL